MGGASGKKASREGDEEEQENRERRTSGAATQLHSKPLDILFFSFSNYNQCPCGLLRKGHDLESWNHGFSPNYTGK